MISECYDEFQQHPVFPSNSLSNQTEQHPCFYRWCKTSWTTVFWMTQFGRLPFWRQFFGWQTQLDDRRFGRQTRLDDRPDWTNDPIGRQTFWMTSFLDNNDILITDVLATNVSTTSFLDDRLLDDWPDWTTDVLAKTCKCCVPDLIPYATYKKLDLIPNATLGLG